MFSVEGFQIREVLHVQPTQWTGENYLKWTFLGSFVHNKSLKLLWEVPCMHAYIHIYISTYTYKHMCTMDSGCTTTTCGHCIHANTHTMTVKKMALKHTYILYVHTYTHACKHTYVRTYMFKGCMRMYIYTYDNSLSMHTLLYMCTYVYTYIRTHMHVQGMKAILVQIHWLKWKQCHLARVKQLQFDGF